MVSLLTSGVKLLTLFGSINSVYFKRFFIRKAISKSHTRYYISNIWLSVLLSSRLHELISKTTYHLKRNAVSKKRLVLCEADKRTTWYRVYPSLTQIETTMHASVLVQQFTHLVCITNALAFSENCPRLSYLLFKQDTEMQQEKADKRKKNEQAVYATDIPLGRKSNGFTVDVRGQTAYFVW